MASSESPIIGWFASVVWWLATTCAAQGDSLFPVSVNYDDEAWVEIPPSEAVRLVDEAVAKQPKYGSGRVRVLVYLNAQGESDRDTVIQLFGELKKTDSPATLREKTAPLRRDVPKDITQKLNWSQVTIAEDGDNVIEKSEKWSSQTWSSTYLSTDKIKIVYEGAQRQADVALPGLQNRMAVHRLTSFHVLLQPVKEQYVLSAAKTPDFVKIVRGSQGGPSRTIVFSLRDGSVLYENSTTSDGTLTKEAWQGPMKEWVGGVRYPTSRLRFEYTDGAVTDVEAVAVQQAEFNVRVEPSEFVVPIPAGTTVVDVREGEPAVVRVKQPIDDLVAALDAGLPTKVRPTKVDLEGADASSTSRWRIGLILLNVVVVAILLVVVLVIRRRAARPG